MAQVRLEGVAKRFGPVSALADITETMADGELTVILGPSGCGKSTLLRVIAGLDEATAGRIFIGDRDVTDLPPAKRDIAMVFQSYALYPHMTVFDNMAFGLKLAGRSRAAVRAKVEEAAKLLRIDGLLDRKPRALSGGQRQRVAMGRALVREPQVFLFDEPLSNLDAALRVEMRFEIAALQKQLGATMVYVTHDQVEAMTLADRILVMRDGRVEQSGAPLDIYRRPVNRFVAGFLGTPGMNFIDGRIVDRGENGLGIALGDGGWIDLPLAAETRLAGEVIQVGVRPEDLMVEKERDDGKHGGVRLSAEVLLVERLGAETHLHLSVAGGRRIIARVGGETSLRQGETVRVSASVDVLHLFDVSGDRIAPVG